ncbi:MAG: hypothetical protein FJ090_05135 [Deltaproteobacteria bacterium]|nr:hypothetical protein [Deltaproteobacteria bacterium]
MATTLVGQKRHREALSFARDAVSAAPGVAAYHALLGITAEALLLDEEAERCSTRHAPRHRASSSSTR